MKYTRLIAILFILVIFTGIALTATNSSKEEATAPETTTEATAPETTTEETTTEETTAPETTVREPTTEEPTTEAPARYTDADLEALALIVYQEAGGNDCTNDTRLKVACVVLNRVDDPRFPDTVQGVALQAGQYGNLSRTGLVWPSRARRASETTAVARAYAIAERALNGERVLPADTVWQAEFKQGTEVVAYQNGIYFCR